jgi:hypothetical protein
MIPPNIVFKKRKPVEMRHDVGRWNLTPGDEE